MPSSLVERVLRAETPARRPRRSGAGLLAAAAVGVVLVVGVQHLGSLLPHVGNPFGARTTTTATPPLLLAVHDLHDYRAAEGTFQVVVEKDVDRRFLPDVVAGSRTTYLATGDVDGLVDLSGLGADRVQLSADRTSVAFRLPAPRLGEARLDVAASRRLSTDRGLADRIGDAFGSGTDSDRQLQLLAERTIATAATRSDLLDRTRSGTTQFTDLAHSLGVPSVTVTYDVPPAP